MRPFSQGSSSESTNVASNHTRQRQKKLCTVERGSLYGASSYANIVAGNSRLDASAVVDTVAVEVAEMTVMVVDTNFVAQLVQDGGMARKRKKRETIVLPHVSKRPPRVSSSSCSLQYRLGVAIVHFHRCCMVTLCFDGITRYKIEQSLSDSLHSPVTGLFTVYSVTPVV